jgi:uncharacterized protein YceK
MLSVRSGEVVSRLNQREAQMRKLLLIFVVFMTGCSGISFRGGPSKSQIKQDITSSMEACMQPLKNDNRPYAIVDAVRIASTKVYNREATVFVHVEYHWVGTPTTGQTSTVAPCNYFNGQSAKNLAQPTLIYRPSGSDWKLIEIR